MNYENATKAIRSFFAAKWGSTTKVAYDDVPFDIPDNETWVRFNIKHVDGYQASIGAPSHNRQRREGFIIAQVFQPQGKGSLDARKKADLIVGHFFNAQTSGIIFHDVHAKEIGNDGAGWYQINVLIKFRYDHIA
jgi:hypothetical protein